MRHHRTAHVDSAQEALLTLGRLVDQALERIRIQRARVELAEALQRHLLPPQLPQLPHIAIAARYTPSRDGLDVGGDWYDAFPMTNGSVGSRSVTCRATTWRPSPSWGRPAPA